jgi:hypothetical protein
MKLSRVLVRKTAGLGPVQVDLDKVRHRYDLPLVKIYFERKNQTRGSTHELSPNSHTPQSALPSLPGRRNMYKKGVSGERTRNGNCYTLSYQKLSHLTYTYTYLTLKVKP